VGTKLWDVQFSLPVFCDFNFFFFETGGRARRMSSVILYSQVLFYSFLNMLPI
jgi:hypothetical protein